MSGFSFDSNIIIDAFAGFEPARAEIRRAAENGRRPWISRMVWVEVLSKGSAEQVRSAETFLSGFGIDELDAKTAHLAATLRRDRMRPRGARSVALSSLRRA